MTVGTEVTVKETVIIVDGGNTKTILSGTKGLLKCVGANQTVSLMIGDEVYPDIPIQSIEDMKDEEDEMKKRGTLDLYLICSRYPDQKPICFNYMQARADVFSLCEEIRRNSKYIQELETKLGKR